MQAAGSAITAILKKTILAIRKNCDNYYEKAVPAVRKSCDSYHEKAVPADKKSYLLWAVGAFRLLGRSFQHLRYGFAENGKISLKGILLFLV